MIDARFGTSVAEKLLLLALGTVAGAAAMAQPTTVVDPLSRTAVTTGDLSPVTL